MFTIKEFLGMDLIPWYKNLTSAQIPVERPIEHVSVNDLPLDDFIRKNEMVISIATAMRLKRRNLHYVIFHV